MARLVALTEPHVCAKAMRQEWPSDPAEQVRCIQAGSQSLGLEIMCAPWSSEAEDSAFADSVGANNDGADPFNELDQVVSWLTTTPMARPVVGLVSGPATWGRRSSSGWDEEVLDVASDLAAERVRSLARCGVELLVILESRIGDIKTELLAELHQPILRAAKHLGLRIVLLQPDPIGSDGHLGYSEYVSPLDCSEGFGYLCREAFASQESLARGIMDQQSVDYIVTDLIPRVIEPELIRKAVVLAHTLGSLGTDLSKVEN